ncbi:heterokaryon incompatibility protein-domain-containing protein [Xylaria sp. FL1042]|nr:heterokaryon incompatibility protein-domain-containing protein [Xylaria sp. FL1042]
MESCPTCRDLIPLPGPSGGFITGGQGIDLANSASNCQVCSILWEGLSTLCVGNPKGVQWIALKQDGDAFRLQYRHSAEDRIWLGLHFYTRDAESPFSDIFKPSSDLEPDTACEKYLAQAQRWVHDCCEKHERCRDRLSTTLPTRVLDVARHENYVFLYEPEKRQTAPYIALSHVWGGEVPIRTTTTTLNRFKDGIRLDSLPQTFRDAIFMTRLLECQYLWIDSLCIIQDSREDWALEATRMADVYGNARVTIAAVMSENSNGGLFSRHEATTVKHTIQRAGKPGKAVIVDVRPALEHASYYESSPYGLPPGTGAKLLGRAWCYQEYLLSPRVMLFTDWEILWVCLARLECNCGQFSRDTRDLISESDLKIRFDRTLRSGSVRELHRLWMDIVHPYSLKDMTYATDKLPALAGIAYLFSEKNLGRYVNGLWESTFVQDLFWEVSWSFVDYYHITIRRPEGLAMPSWSWASVAGPIDMNPDADIEGLEVVETSFEHNKLGSLTDVSTQSLTLRGIFISARVWGGQKTRQGYIHPHRRLTADGIPEASWVLDVATEVTCDQDNPIDACILCGTKGPGLVLVSVQEPSQGASASFKRLGKIKQLPVQRSHYGLKSIQLV